MIRVKDLCKCCKHFDWGAYSCKQNASLWLDPDLCTIECDEYEPDDEDEGEDYET